jgi:hypothetical protein
LPESGVSLSPTGSHGLWLYADRATLRKIGLAAALARPIRQRMDMMSRATRRLLK